MYEEFFGLSGRPFPAVPNVDHYYPGTAIKSAGLRLIRCVERAEGVGIVIGPSGTGKTLLLMVLAEHFKESFQVALLSSGRLGTRRALLQAVLFELGRPYRDMDEGELRLALVDYLTLGEDCPQGMLLLVDEAHTLPLRLLEEIRVITNLVAGGRPRARLVLAGGALLEERLASPKLESFSQRIAARCYLESFNRDETQAYVHAQLDTVGGRAEQLIPADACSAVYQATDGIPRLINQVCDHALLLARAAGREQIDRRVVEEAWADLQQLPVPWNEDSGQQRSESGIIEFGGLEDEPEQVEGPADGRQSPDVEVASLPMLRISPDSEDESADPVEQVEQIEQALSGLEGDFEPPASTGPELELVFDPPHDPFGEEFEEEEVIAGRCLPKAPIDLEEVPRPHLRRDLGQPASAGHGSAEAVPRESEGSPPRCDEASVETRPAAKSEGGEKTLGPAEPDEAPHWAERPETVPMRFRQPVAMTDEDESGDPEAEEIIIVEEGYDDAEPMPTRSAAPVRRQEYRQLFARLRRGG